MNTYCKFFLCLVLTGISFVSYTQKVDFDKKKVTLQYIDPPLNSDLNRFNTYSVEFVADQKDLNQLGIKPAIIEEFFKLEGFAYMPEQGDLVYSIFIGTPKLLKEEVISKDQQIKNPDGSTKTVTEFFAFSQYNIPTVIQILDNSSLEVLYVNVISTGGTPTTFQSGAMATKEDAQRILNFKEGGMNMSARELYRKELTAAVNKFKREHDYAKGSYTQEFLDVNTSKNPELSSFHNEVTTVTDALVKATADMPLFETQSQLAPILDRWKAEAGKINSEDKNLKKLKFLYLYNLAVSQLWLEFYNDALETCKLIRDNDFKPTEATEIEQNIAAIKSMMAKRGVTSRHAYRKGFRSTARYTYTPKPVEKTNFITKSIQATVQDFEELKKSGQEFKQIGVDVKKDLKDEFGKKVLGDTIAATNAMFSTLKVTIDGEAIEYNKRGLSTGHGSPAGEWKDGVYSIDCWKNDKFYELAVKEGELGGISMEFYSEKYTRDNIKPETILNFLKGLNGGEMMDIATSSRFDSVPFYQNGVSKKLPNFSWKDYGKDISADIEFVFRTKSRDDIYSFKTMNGEKFQVKLLESWPIVVRGNGGVCSSGYVARIFIPEVRITKLNYGHYLPSYRDQYKVAKDLEMFVILK